MNKTTKISINQIITPIIFIVFATVFEVVNFVTLDYTTVKSNVTQILPTYFIFDFLLFFLIASIMFFINKRWISNTIMFVFLSFQALFNIITATLKNANGTILSTEQISLAKEAFTAFDFCFIDINSIIANLVVLIVLILTINFLGLLKKKEITIKNKFIISLSIFLSSIVFFTSSFFVVPLAMPNKKSETQIIDNSKILWKNLSIPDEAHRRFGTVGYYVKSIYNDIFTKYTYDKYKSEYLNLIKNGVVSKNESATLFGDNVIFLMLESYDTFAVDPYNTPTLYNLFNNESVYFTNYFSENKTNIVEYITLLGNSPSVSLNSLKPDTDKFSKSNSLTSKYSIPNAFKSLDYQTNYFHCYMLDFYNRNITHKSFGFDNLYDYSYLDEIKPVFNIRQKEVDYFDAVKEYMIPTNVPKFMSFYLTVATHGTYSIQFENFSEFYQEYDNNLENFKNYLENELNYSYPQNYEHQQLLKEFKSRAIDTDRMIESLLNHLKNTTNSNGEKLIDNTTLVIFADHNAYYDDNIAKKIKGTDFNNLYNVPFAIYSKKLEAKKVNDFSNVYDIYPTVCNLFGLPHNTFMSLGRNLFEENTDSIFVYYSHTVGFFNDKLYTKNLKTFTNPLNLSQDEIYLFKLKSCKILEKQLIFKTVYYAGWTSDMFE